MPRPPHTSRQAAMLFATLLDQPDRWWHGYALMQETGLRSGSLYPLLIRLADDSFLEDRWDLAGEQSRPRREYRLTASGRALASERLARFAARAGLTEPKPDMGQVQ